MMTEMLYPQRQRCKACRKAFGTGPTDLVRLGLYCSPACAGLATPTTDPAQAPRECRTMEDDGRTWRFKRGYQAESLMPRRLREDPALSAYWCGHCGLLHVGRTQVERTGQTRALRQPDDLAETMVKLRGQTTRRQVAAAAGIRPIRLKEIETPGERVDLAALLAVLGVYRVDLALVFRA